MYTHDILGVDAYSLVIIVVSIICTAFLFYLARREGIVGWRLLVMQCAMALITLAGAKLFSLYVRDWQLAPLAMELRSGWRWPGGLLAFVVFGPMLAPRILGTVGFLRYGDLMGITLALGMGVMRIACFLTACCLGDVNHGLGLAYAKGSNVWQGQYSDGLIPVTAPASLPVTPLHLYFMLTSFAVAAFLLWFDPRRHYNGQVLLVFLLLHETAKGLLETFRHPYIAELQATSLTTALVAATLLVLAYSLQRQQPGGSTA